MPRFQYTILSRAHAGREDEFIAWYRDTHLADVCKMPGVVGGQLFRMDFQRVYEWDAAPQWTLMTIYELEGDHPEAIIDAIRAASGSAHMPACDALHKGGMIQAAGHLIASAKGIAPAGTTYLPARTIPIPEHLSPMAQFFLSITQPKNAWPSIDDTESWLKIIKSADESIIPLLRQIGGMGQVQTTEHQESSAKIYDIIAEGVDADGPIVLDIHGGALIMAGGELCKMMGTGTALRLQKRIWSVDYRMPPLHPYPAALDDCIAAYRGLLKIRPASQIIVSGGSAGGNLAAALMLRARDEGLPLPAGLLLGTPEIDLTESGDSFATNLGVDPSLESLMPVNLLYAAGHDLKHPYLSPLYGDFSLGFPPTILTTGTRDLYLSNTVRMHRALRAADIRAELHITDAAPHTGFPGSPEGALIDKEIQLFMQSVLVPEG